MIDRAVQYCGVFPSHYLISISSAMKESYWLIESFLCSFLLCTHNVNVEDGRFWGISGIFPWISSWALTFLWFFPLVFTFLACSTRRSHSIS